jgi:hypothetical protein
MYSRQHSGIIVHPGDADFSATPGGLKKMCGEQALSKSIDLWVRDQMFFGHHKQSAAHLERVDPTT